MRTRLVITILAALLLHACGEPEHEAVAPAPGELSREAIGYYCNMIVIDHHGPKGQVFISGRDEPIWFTSVRDTITFTLLPEEPKNIAAIYVNDMGRASWNQPEPDTWIDARQASYVIGSDKVGGMGAPEAVPFADRSAAEAFASRYGGKVVAFDEVPRDYLLTAVPVPTHASMHQGTGNTISIDAGTDTPAQHAHDNSAVKVTK